MCGNGSRRPTPEFVGGRTVAAIWLQAHSPTMAAEPITARQEATMAKSAVIDKFLHAIESATIPGCDVWSQDATLDATVPNRPAAGGSCS
jgi:hypothetical protein